MSRLDLALEGQTLQPGESVRMRCPFCHGGPREDKRSLSLTHTEDGALLYHCYRNACGAAGVLGRGSNLVHTRPAPKPSRTKPHIEDRLECVGELMAPAWHAGAEEWDAAGVRWDPATERLALPMYAPDFRLRGRVLRCLPWDDRTPKALTHLYIDEPTLSWNREPGEYVVVVEDIPSALRLGMFGVRAVALNGTHLTDAAVEELDSATTDVVWALDPDALKKGMEWRQRTRIYFRHSVVLVIDKDFKDMTDEEVLAWRSEIYSAVG